MTGSSDQPNESEHAVPRAFRSIEAAAIAGFIYSALFLVSSVLLLRSPQPSDTWAAEADWYLSSSNQQSIVLAMNLLTMSTIAFLWFVAVIRRRVGVRESRFFGTVFLGSGLLLSAAWLVGGMFLAIPAISAYLFSVEPDLSQVSLTSTGAVIMLSIVATRLGSVFVISATTIGRLSGVFPRWLVIGGYVIGLALLFIPVPTVALQWLFPSWVTVTSLVLLVRRDRVEVEPHNIS